MEHEQYRLAIRKIALAYLILFFHIHLGTLNMIPNWIGYLIFYKYLDDIAYYEKSVSLLQPIVILLMVYEFVEWLIVCFGGTIDIYVVEAMMTSLSLYFHYQLLTNIADIAKKHHSLRSQTIRQLRTVKIIITTFLTLFSQGNVYIYTAIACVGIVVEILLYVVLKHYSEEEKGLCYSIGA